MRIFFIWGSGWAFITIDAFEQYDDENYLKELKIWGKSDLKLKFSALADYVTTVNNDKNVYMITHFSAW